jgi:hypothetical protein
MAKHWAVIVGINQYQSLQPLMYAQSDAIELKQFFVQELGWPQAQCFLLTDVAFFANASTPYPAGASICQQLQKVCQNQLAAEDTLWFFFSGYGIAWEGQDMLLPIDADPTQLDRTAIPIQQIFDCLNTAPTDKLLVVLDINRSQSALPNQHLGAQALELAKGYKIPLILSCQPDQFSQETLAVRHGLFTAALLEGMKFHGCLTLSQLVAYLSDRLPELCKHHSRPIQNPAVVVPPEHQFLMLVPPYTVTRLPLTQAAAMATANLATDAPASLGAGDIPSEPSLASASSNEMERAAIVEAPQDSKPEPETPQPNESEDDDEIMPVWQRWGLVAAAVMFLGVFAMNRSIFLGGRGEDPGTASQAEITSEENTTTSEAADAVDTSETGTTPIFPEDSTATASPSALDRAAQAVAAQRYGEALEWLDQVPIANRDQAFATLWSQAQAGYSQSGDTNQEILDSAYSQMQPVSVTPFKDAIAEAQQVPLGDPLYEQAQADITRWSRTILDVADGRAAAGQLQDAIAAAQLIPENRPALQQMAQERIRRWQQQLVNRDVLKQAQLGLEPGNAASFKAAIDLVKPIGPEYPEYATAQERLRQWSEDILAIARAKAAKGDIQGAIAAAAMVPDDSTVYPQAQQEIQRWQEQL